MCKYLYIWLILFYATVGMGTERIVNIGTVNYPTQSLFACSLSVLPKTTIVLESDIGKAFVCSLWISGIKGTDRLAGWQTNVEWTPTVLKADSTKKGAFLKDHSDAIFWMSGVIDNTVGNITGFCEVLMGWNGYPELVGNGSATIIYFTIEGKGSTNIHLDLEGTGLTYPLADKDANEIPSDMVDGYFQCGPVGVDENSNLYSARAQGEGKAQSSNLEIYPNPFNQSTVISYQLPVKIEARSKKQEARLTIYDLTGRLVRTFPISNFQFPIPNSIAWDGKDDNSNLLPSGIYFCKLQLGKESVTKQMFLLR